MDTISVIILACNKSEYTKRTLDGLLHTKLSPSTSFEFILVDNGSTDNTPSVLNDFKTAANVLNWQVVVLRQSENIGAIAGRNLALSEASGEYIVFMDNDIVVGRRSWAERLKQVLCDDHSIGIVGPKILYAAPPHFIQSAGCEIDNHGRVHFRCRGLPHDAGEASDSQDVQALISAAWMMRRSMASELGELDMLYHPVQFEDIDYCYRARSSGWRVVYDPSVWCYHFENTTTGSIPGKTYSWLTVKNGKKFKEKWSLMIESEKKPEDRNFIWQHIDSVPFESIGELEMVE